MVVGQFKNYPVFLDKDKKVGTIFDDIVKTCQSRAEPVLDPIGDGNLGHA